jgi:hypothetical protein
MLREYDKEQIYLPELFGSFVRKKVMFDIES